MCLWLHKTVWRELSGLSGLFTIFGSVRAGVWCIMGNILAVNLLHNHNHNYNRHLQVDISKNNFHSEPLQKSNAQA